MANAQYDDDMEDLEANAAVMLMANMQELLMGDTGPVYDTDALSEVNELHRCFTNDIASSSVSASYEEQVVQHDSLFSSQEDGQINTFVSFDDDDQINPVVTFDDDVQINQPVLFDNPLDDAYNAHVEQHEPSANPDSELELRNMLLNNHIGIQKYNAKLRAQIVLLKRDLECCKIQITNFETRDNREKSFEVAFQKSYVKEQDLQHQLNEVTASKNELTKQMENERFEHKQQIIHLNDELSKTKSDLSICQADFRKHRIKSREKIESYAADAIELEKKLQEFKNVVYKTGESITTIQKFTMQLRPPSCGYGLGYETPCFLKIALKETPKLYSAEQFFDESVVRVVVYDREEEEEIEDETRSKMTTLFYDTPFVSSTFPHLYASFVPQKEKTVHPWALEQINHYLSSEEAPKPVTQINGPLPDFGQTKPLPKRCSVMRYFKMFTEDIQFLEQAIERNTEITVSTFQNTYEKATREIFVKQFLPHIQHLRLCATHWEKELQQEVESMMEVPFPSGGR